MDEVKNRFYDKFHKGEGDECWIWKGAICKDKWGGRARFRIGGDATTASRASWIIHFGKIPDGMYVCHTCDNGLCVNPSHLFIGSAYDNNHDMMKKGRYVCLYGEDCPSSKLTENEVLEIRRLYKRGKTTYKKLSEIYNVTSALIGYIVTRKIWRQI